MWQQFWRDMLPLVMSTWLGGYLNKNILFNFFYKYSKISSVPEISYIVPSEFVLQDINKKGEPAHANKIREHFYAQNAISCYHYLPFHAYLHYFNWKDDADRKKKLYLKPLGHNNMRQLCILSWWQTIFEWANIYGYK